VKKLDFYLRTALALVGFLGVTLAFLVPCLVLWGHPRLASWYARSMSRVVRAALGLHVTVKGREHLESQPCLYVPNHQSNLDAVVMGTIYPPRTVVIGKRSVAFIPLFGLIFLATRNIMINRHVRAKAIAGLDRAVDVLRTRGDSIWIFPEGTRNRTGEVLGPFKKGAFHMAVEAQVPLVPIVSGPVLNYVDLDHKVLRKGPIEIRILEPILTAGLGHDDVDALLEKVRGRMHVEAEDIFRRAGVLREKA
jgi:1-acyl-sn-glycerol-3-phosphate acyltransferase